MQQSEGLPIPPLAVVRDHLARNLRENRLLRSLLRVSERAAEEAASDHASAVTRSKPADGRGRRTGVAPDC